MPPARERGEGVVYFASQKFHSKDQRAWRAATHYPCLYVCRKCAASKSDARQPASSGNNPGIHREASFAGKASRKGARELSETITSRSICTEVRRLA